MNDYGDVLFSSNAFSVNQLEDLEFFANKFGIVFDRNTTFDIIKSCLFAQANLSKSDRIFFSNAYKNDTLQLICSLGFYRLIGMDTFEDIYDQPNYWKIKFYRGDILETHLPPNLFKAYFAINTIEYLSSQRRNIYFLIKKFLIEAQRIIDDNGYLIITSTLGDTFIHKNKFTVLGPNNIDYILSTAKSYGFDLISGINFDYIDKPLTKNGVKYTKIFLVFKLHKTILASPTKIVNIISPMAGVDGITIYAENLKIRFEEAGIKVNLVSDYTECDKSYPVIYEYEPSLYRILPRNKNVYIEAHSTDLRIIRIAYLLIKKHSIRKAALLLSQRISLKRHARLMIRSRDLVGKFLHGLRNYYIMPHIAYPDKGIRAHPKGLSIGSFGFALPFKNFDKICDLAIRLNVPCVLLLSVNDASKSGFEISKKTIKKLKEKYEHNENIKIRYGFFSDEEILRYLSNCSHIIFAQEDSSQTSGSYRFPVQLNVPIIATNSFQAKESQVIRVKSLDELDIAKLEAIRDRINLDDGFEYLLNIIRFS